jgi:hypothetical protein
LENGLETPVNRYEFYFFSTYKRDFKMIIYPGLPHGFLQFDAPQGMKESAITIADAQAILKELLES